MTSIDASNVVFVDPAAEPDGPHHAEAADGNRQAAVLAFGALSDALSGTAETRRILIRAAAGAGKSVQLQRMVIDALSHPACVRVAVTAFMNRQIWPLAKDLGTVLGQDAVCLLSSAGKLPEVPADVSAASTVVSQTAAIPADARVVIAVAAKLGAPSELQRHEAQLGPGGNDDRPYDVLFVDEAWQLALHYFAGVERYAPIVVGVGDVGQLPPIDIATNPWRGDPGYNPYRAWPTAFESDDQTFAIDLPAVWRPHAHQLAVWRAFYRDWEQLDSVAAPDDRSIDLPPMTGAAADVWGAVATGKPVLLEVAGLPDPEAPDIDAPLLEVVEALLDPLVGGTFTIRAAKYDADGNPAGTRAVTSDKPSGDPLIVIVASRNAAVNDAHALAARLAELYDLPDGVITASTVDKWQGQTNRITIGIHPLSGADELDDFNSAFGRLAVTCTRATHGLLLITRSGIEDLLTHAPARPGTPLNEPGVRTLPRQTHQRILEAFSRGVLTVAGPSSTAS